MGALSRPDARPAATLESRPVRVASLALLLLAVTLTAAEEHTRRITWQDVAPIHARLTSRGFSAHDFDTRIARLAADNERRVRIGDVDHLVFYMLQSTRFTDRTAIEPALSAKSLVDGLDDAWREAFFRDPASARDRVSRDVRARVHATVEALDAPGTNARLAYFARLLAETAPDARARERTLLDEYLRVMRFVHEKEFGSGRADAAAAASLYHTRGLSTDTAVEAGFIVSQGLGVLRALDPERRIRRVLIVGAGLDLAPRTALLEAAPPQSYQPWAVLDALVDLGLSRLDDVTIVSADINDRVVHHLRDSRASPPLLTLLTGIGETGPISLAREYRAYFGSLGRSIGLMEDAPPQTARDAARAPAGHLYKRLKVSAEAARAVRATQLDVVTERLDGRGRGGSGHTGAGFDLVVATNVFPYFDDDGLALALSNIASMLGPGGVLLHNEARPALHDISAALGLPPSHSRHAVIATVKGAPPLGDSVWLHERQAPPPR